MQAAKTDVRRNGTYGGTWAVRYSALHCRELFPTLLRAGLTPQSPTCHTQVEMKDACCKDPLYCIGG